MSIIERFESKVFIAPDSCWIWTAALSDNGYGLIKTNKKLVRAHRYIYEQVIGPIKVGLQLDHLCRNRSCVNPYHLEPVTQGENVRRGNRTKEICKHEIGVTSCINGCKNKYQREYRAKRKGN